MVILILSAFHFILSFIIKVTLSPNLSVTKFIARDFYTKEQIQINIDQYGYP